MVCLLLRAFTRLWRHRILTNILVCLPVLSFRPSFLFFFVDVDSKTAVLSSFMHVTSNTWWLIHPDNYRKSDDYGKCNCTDECGDTCINSATQVECFDNDASTSSDSNCPLGPGCGNRRLQNQQWACVDLLEPKNTGGKGWGLVATAGLRRGDLVIEYVGEVITTSNNNRRLVDHRRKRPDDASMYSVAMGGGLFVDARRKGNLARFVNHSCDPNCVLHKWDVMGLTRIAVVALKDIQSGTELCVDYQLSTNEAGYFQCYCGARHCRGTLAGGDHAPGYKKEPDQPSRDSDDSSDFE